MENVSEWQRRAHEELDRVEAAMVELLLSNPSAGNDAMIPTRFRAFKQKLVVEHQLAAFLAQMTATAKALKASHERDTLKNDEINALNIQGADLSPFYQQLKQVKDHHRRLPPNTPATDSLELTSILDKARISAANLSGMFSGEEAYGRFLDLNGLFEEALQVMGPARVEEVKFDYLAFMRQFAHVHSYIPEGKRSSAAYVAFLDSLLEYLQDFLARSRPLSPGISESEELKALEVTFTVELSNLSDESDNKLYCAPCQKLFSNQAVFDGHLNGKRHLKAQSDNPKGDADCALQEAKERLLQTRKCDLQKRHSIARKELQIQLFGELLKEVTKATLGNVERRQALTPEERAALEVDEAEEDETTQEIETTEETEDSSQLADGRIYNPLKLPLDWDGKPIPFWLWKLHGLGVEFSCEICGNFVYMGRRAFDQHFYEWRHSHGMKCLGIPNTRHFFQITKIEEAKRLWERMREQAREQVFRPDQQEECEDAAGNVYERRTYEDLKRQGLL